MPVEALIFDHAALPVYLRIADKSKHLRDVGMSDRAIAAAPGVSAKAVAKAVARPEFSLRSCPDPRKSRD